MSSNGNLKSLDLLVDGTTLPLPPAFKLDIMSYSVETEAKQFEFKTNTEQGGAKVTLMLNGQMLSNGVKLSLAEGDNKLEVIVTAENGTKKIYTITIHRKTDNTNDTDNTEKPELPKLPTDIAGYWAEQQIQQVVLGKFVSGYPGGTFQPNNTITRAEFTVMLMSVLNPDGNGATLAFTDRESIPAWSQTAISLAAHEGIISGYQDGSFKPNRIITRAEMAMMIAKALGMVSNGVTATGFADETDIPPMAKGAVKALSEAGILNGRSGNQFAPNASMTRAEAVVLLLRLQELNEGK